MSNLDNRKLVIDHIIDREFVPKMFKKIISFSEELSAKAVTNAQWEIEIGFPLYQGKSILDVKDELNELSDKLCKVFTNNTNG